MDKIPTPPTQNIENKNHAENFSEEENSDDIHSEKVKTAIELAIENLRREKEGRSEDLPLLEARKDYQNRRIIIIKNEIEKLKKKFNQTDTIDGRKKIVEKINYLEEDIENRFNQIQQLNKKIENMDNLNLEKSFSNSPQFVSEEKDEVVTESPELIGQEKDEPKEVHSENFNNDKIKEIQTENSELIGQEKDETAEIEQLSNDDLEIRSYKDEMLSIRGQIESLKSILRDLKMSASEAEKITTKIKTKEKLLFAITEEINKLEIKDEDNKVTAKSQLDAGLERFNLEKIKEKKLENDEWNQEKQKIKESENEYIEKEYPEELKNKILEKEIQKKDSYAEKIIEANVLNDLIEVLNELVNKANNQELSYNRFNEIVRGKEMEESLSKIISDADDSFKDEFINLYEKRVNLNNVKIEQDVESVDKNGFSEQFENDNNELKENEPESIKKEEERLTFPQGNNHYLDQKEVEKNSFQKLTEENDDNELKKNESYLSKEENPSERDESKEAIEKLKSESATTESVTDNPPIAEEVKIENEIDTTSEVNGGEISANSNLEQENEIVESDDISLSDLDPKEVDEKIKTGNDVYVKLINDKTGEIEKWKIKYVNRDLKRASLEIEMKNGAKRVLYDIPFKDISDQNEKIRSVENKFKKEGEEKVIEKEEKVIEKEEEIKEKIKETADNLVDILEKKLKNDLNLNKDEEISKQIAELISEKVISVEDYLFCLKEMDLNTSYRKDQLENRLSAYRRVKQGESYRLKETLKNAIVRIIETDLKEAETARRLSIK